jgi:hypothetical protein
MDQMKRREFFTLLGGAAAWPLAAHAQPRKMYRIGVLWHGANAEEETIYLAALRQGLDDFGYVEGQNVALQMRFPAEQYERSSFSQPNLPSKKWTYWFRQQGSLPSRAVVQRRRSQLSPSMSPIRSDES